MENPSQMTITRPLKAPTNSITDAELATLQLPVYVSDKLDGIRCLNHPTLGPVSQKLKPIPNDWIRHIIQSSQLPYLDGEIIIPNLSFNDIQSVVMSKRHPRQMEFQYHVFDHFEFADATYEVRLEILINKLHNAARHLHTEFLKLVSQYYCESLPEIQTAEVIALEQGFEGIMIRSPYGHYKCGRSTLREQLLLKRKPTDDAEGIIIDFIEEEENCNVATTDEWGLSKRSSHQANKRGKDTLGAFRVRWGVEEFNIGSGRGLTKELRQHIWDNQSLYWGQTITFTYQKHGMKNLPRSPQFKGFRKD